MDGERRAAGWTLAGDGVSGLTLLQLLEHGGIVMYPLLLCSVVTVAIIFERVWTITKAARGARHLHQLVEESMREQNVADAAAVCRRDASVLGPVFRAVVAALFTAQALIGSLLGAGETDAAWALARRLLGYGAFFGTAVGVLLVLLHGVIPPLFTPDDLP